MRQVIMKSPGDIKYNEVEQPHSPIGNDVLLRIKKIGICGSDVHVYRGEHPAVNFPVVQGHEYSAVVEEIGEDVKYIKPGMVVTGRPQQVCGNCKQCLRGDYNICNNLKVEGFQAPGVGQELFLIPEERVVPLAAKMSLDSGAMVEPTAVAVHSTGRVGSLKGKNVVVSGAGTIGNLVAQYAAKVRGAKKVVITDVSNYRLHIARECGIESTINVKEASFSEEIKKCFGVDGFQVAMEAAGVAASLDALIENVDKGGDVVIIGVYAKNPKVNMYYLGEHELRMTGSLMYLHEDFQEAINAISNDKINLSPLISGYFPFEDFKGAYKYIEQKKDKVMKIIMEM